MFSVWCSTIKRMCLYIGLSITLSKQSNMLGLENSSTFYTCVNYRLSNLENICTLYTSVNYQPSNPNLTCKPFTNDPKCNPLSLPFSLTIFGKKILPIYESAYFLRYWRIKNRHIAKKAFKIWWFLIRQFFFFSCRFQKVWRMLNRHTFFFKVIRIKNRHTFFYAELRIVIL